jgi:bifunctional non-homologous end joining protein LigD
VTPTPIRMAPHPKSPSAVDVTLPHIEPQLATAAERAPLGPGWVHEIKYDGYRLIAELNGGVVRLLTRHRKDWTDRFPAVANALHQLRLGAAVLDGEVVVMRSDGTSSFQDLQNVLSGSRGTLRYCLFDVPYADHTDLRDRSLIERKEALQEILSAASLSGVLHYTDHVDGNGAAFLQQARAHGLEGIISKRRDAPYRSGRSRDWLKIKCAQRQEFIVVGFTDPRGERPGIGALLLAAHAAGGQLVFTGRVGTGFSDRLLANLRAALAAISCADCPLGTVPASVPARGAHWVQPRLVVEVAFSGWTADGLLRHPSFKGLREDKAAADVSLEL